MVRPVLLLIALAFCFGSRIPLHGQVKTTASPQTTIQGAATFTVLEGWIVKPSGSALAVVSPEGDTRIWMVELAARDSNEAVQKAWASVQPDMHRPLRVVTEPPDRQGWTRRQTYEYETSPNERAVIEGSTYYAGGKWTVLLLQGTQPTLEKRGSQVNLLFQSLRPKGYTRETFAGRKALALTPARVEELKAFLEDSMKKLRVPGAGVAFLDGGRVVYEGGLGVRELGKPDPVDANTLFMAASNTKGMTTLLLARLVDDGKLRWDEPVTEAYAPFRLGSAETTRQVQIQHLICACTGLPRQDLEWLFEFGKASPASALSLLGTMQPTSRFGELFQYSNLMAAAAGYIGGHLYDLGDDLGTAYDKAMQEQVFDPLGMTATTFNMARAQAGNFASPHAADIDGHPAVATMENNYSIVPFRPAGGAWTSAHDLARYVQLELAQGRLPDGRRLVSERNLLKRRQPQVLTGEDESYGMGLWTNARWGVPVVHHGGNLFGYKSDLMFLPDAGIGAVLLTNSDEGGMLLGPLMRRLLEVVYDGRPEAADTVNHAAENFRLSLRKERARLATPAAKPAVTGLATHYTSPALGSLSVKQAGDATVFDFGEWRSAVASRGNDDGTTSFITIEPTRSGFEFVKGEREGKRVLTIRDGQHAYDFTESR